MMTFGYELELGDIRRDRVLPKTLGTWEYAETDIVNLHPPYRNIACDPLGKEPPVGGEINIYPAPTVGGLAERVINGIDWFKQAGDWPSASCVNHGHVHVHVPGLRQNIKLLKQITKWIIENQEDMIRLVYGYREDPQMKLTKTARTYLKWDGGRPMPPWMGANIIERAKTFDDFIRIQCCGKDGVSMGRPLRYAINTYCLKHTDTIEFRLFRCSLDPTEIYDSIRLVRDVTQVMLAGTSESIGWILKTGHYSLPRFFYDHESYLGWEKTKWSKERGKKERHYYDID